MCLSPAVKREESSNDGPTAGTSASTVAQLYHRWTGNDLHRERRRGDSYEGNEDVKDEEDEDDDNDTTNEEPCDLRLLTPATCLQEIYTPLASGDFSARSSSASMVPYAIPGLAETLISNIPKLPAYGTNPAGLSSTGTPGGMPTASAAIPALRNIRVPGTSSSPAGGGGGGANQTTPGGAYACQRCGNSYARPHSLNRHIRFECGVEPKFECPVCHKKSKHKHNLVLHMRTHQQR